MSKQFLGEIFTIGFMPMVAFGYLQLALLKKAVDSAKEEVDKHDN